MREPSGDGRAGSTASPPAGVLDDDTGGHGERPPDGLPPGRGTRRRRVAVAAALLLAATAAVVTVTVVLASRSSKRAGAETSLRPGETTATIARRTLSESSTVDGTLGYRGSSEIYDRLAGTFTWLPSVGSVITPGDTLFRLNDRPVVLMYGSVPAYRTMKLGVGSGRDVEELNDNLIRLGFDPYATITDKRYFSDATDAAVRRWQKAEGLPQTGTVELGRVAFAAGAQRVATVHVAVGQDPPGSSAEQPQKARPSSSEPHPPASNPTAKKPPAKKTPAKKRPGRASRKPTKAAADPPAAGKEGKPKEPHGNPSGESGGGAEKLALSTTSTQQIVQLKVKAEQQQLAHVGEQAPVSLPGGGTVRGRVIDVGTVATAAKENEKGGGGGNNEGGESATIPVTLALERRVAHLDAAPVSVALVKSVRRDVLTVPATALTATAGGGYAIEVIEGRRRVPVAVTPGMFADGYVQIEGPGVRAGLSVIESR